MIRAKTGKAALQCFVLLRTTMSTAHQTTGRVGQSKSRACSPSSAGHQPHHQEAEPTRRDLPGSRRASARPDLLGQPRCGSAQDEADPAGRMRGTDGQREQHHGRLCPGSGGRHAQQHARRRDQAEEDDRRQRGSRWPRWSEKWATSRSSSNWPSSPMARTSSIWCWPRAT